MGGKLDFSIIIAALVLLQLYVLGMNVKKESKIEKAATRRRNTVISESQEPAVTEAAAARSLTVHRNNGEEKVYTKSNVA